MSMLAPIVKMSPWHMFSVLCCLAVSAAIRCYMGDQLYQGPLLLRESVSLTDCPSSRFCVRQEVTSADLKTVNFICDQTADVHGGVFVICQGVGTHVSTTPTGIQSINTCCASDFCNLFVSSSSYVTIYYCIVVVLFCTFLV